MEGSEQAMDLWLLRQVARPGIRRKEDKKRPAFLQVGAWQENEIARLGLRFS